MNPGPTILVVMGVSGAGKTTVGQALARRLGWPFKEGDDLHPSETRDRMTAGLPLNDADRGPWLSAIGAWIDLWRQAKASGVITCSALKRTYRDALRNGRPEVRFVFLQGEPGLLSARLAGRQGHFMPPALLASQLADLEPPSPAEPVIPVDMGLALIAQVDIVVAALGKAAAPRART